MVLNLKFSVAGLLTGIIAAALFAISFQGLRAQDAFFEHPPISYGSTEVNDPVARLISRIESGEIQLEYESSKTGYLRSLLAALDIPLSSQTLVFSKTSMQVHKISPQRPRAIYFNDDVYVGYVQGRGMIELGATDPQQGAIFYGLAQQPPTDQSVSPEIMRDRGQCIVCHASSRTQNVPGYLIRSVYPNRSGHPQFNQGSFNIDHKSPFDQRWGGWYVTGTHGAMQHLGNQTFDGDGPVDLQLGANQESLDDLPFRLVLGEKYPSAHSDIVALMVLEHQVQMHNAITFANFETRLAVHQNQTMNQILEREQDYVSESTERRIVAACERVIEYLFFCDEFELTDPVIGSSSFASEFTAAGPFDSQRRSLREFDLQKRIFRYPLSYLIYSESFDQLPDQVRLPIIARINQILSGQDTSEKFQHLNSEIRSAIRDILHETKPEILK